MQQHDTENLFRRYKGKLVTIKTISGAIYDGKIGEITNNFVSLVTDEQHGVDTYLFFGTIESMMVSGSR